jgi:hypothetical protein
MTYTTEQELRTRFAKYFSDLRDAMLSEDGAAVCKFAEWDNFIEFMIDDGEIPESARNWKCPRNIEAEIRK